MADIENDRLEFERWWNSQPFAFKKLLPSTQAANLIWVEAARTTRAPLQAKIDALMIQYCPDEMTAEQMANYEAHQRPVSNEVAAAIDAAVLS